jgi:hypothetical protein
LESFAADNANCIEDYNKRLTKRERSLQAGQTAVFNDFLICPYMDYNISVAVHESTHLNDLDIKYSLIKHYMEHPGVKLKEKKSKTSEILDEVDFK